MKRFPQTIWWAGLFALIYGTTASGVCNFFNSHACSRVCSGSNPMFNIATYQQKPVLKLVKKLSVLSLVAVVAYMSADLWSPAIGNWLLMPTAPNLLKADVIIVHGGNPDRRTYGISLYHHEMAPKLWLTGYTTMEAHIHDMVVNSGGVPQEAYQYLDTTSTWSDGTEIAAAIRAHKLHSVIIVTDWWHSRRALCSTEQQLQGYDMAIEFVPSPSTAGPDSWWKNPEIRKDVLSELVKLAYYAVRYGMSPWGC